MTTPSHAVNTKRERAAPRKPSIRETNEKRIMAAAEEVFAQVGFNGATTGAIARLAGVPKANLHYYFSTKAELYRRVTEDVCEHWLAAARAFDETDDPKTAIGGYIRAKMEQARTRPFGSRVWALEILRGAPVIDGYLHDTLKTWFEGRKAKLGEWIAAGKMQPVDPQTLLFMIWGTTQHYADFAHQISVLNADQDLTDAQFENATEEVCRIILTGIGLKP